MAKPILGDDPFQPNARGGEAPARPTPKRADDAKPRAKTPPVKQAKAKGPAKPAAKQPSQPRSKPAQKAKAKVAKAPAAKAPAAKAAKAPAAKAPVASAKAPVAPVAKAPVAPSVKTDEGVPAAVAERAASVKTDGRPPAASTAIEAAAPLASAAGTDARPAASEIATSPVPAAAVADDYGPSIDRPPPVGLHRRIAAEVQKLEHQVRDEARERLGVPEGPSRRLPLEFLLRHWRALAMRDRSDVVDEFGRDPTVAARVEPLLDFLYRTYFRVDVRGIGNVPDEGRALIVANHSGTLPYDGAMIMHAVRREHAAHREVRPLVEDFVFHFPYLGTLMNRIGGVRACQENAERLLAHDRLVAVFPEGIKGIGKLYSQRYQLQRFGRGGFVKLALATDSPIIPAAVVGAEEIHPMLTKVTWFARSIGIPYIPVTPTFPWLGPLGLVPLPAKWYLAFGEPLYFNVEYGAEGGGDRILVNKLAEQVRQRIQEMIDALLKERRSVILG